MLQLREYQLKAVAAALPHYGFAQFMEQRTGKTIVALELSRIWECLDILVICPKKAVPVWSKEILAMGLDPSKYTIIGFESFRIKHKSMLRKWGLVIVDESHRIKERSSQITKACWKISKYATRRLILSGTPQGQGMEDYYSQLKFIRPDLFGTWKDFSERYLIIEKQWLAGREDPFPRIIGYKNQDEFKEILASLSYRVTRDEVSKVKTVVRNRIHHIPTRSEFQTNYEQMSQKLFIEINEQMISAPMVLVKASKLHQICGGFIRDENRVVHLVHKDKLEYLRGLLEGELKGQSIAIVANYKAEMDAISSLLTELGLTHVQIRGGHQYNPKDRSQVTILNPSAGEAINLAHHTVMVVYSMNHSFLKWAQFKDRIVLVDTPEVKYHYLIIPGTMDEVVYKAVSHKKKLSEEVMSIYKSRLK